MTSEKLNELEKTLIETLRKIGDKKQQEKSEDVDSQPQDADSQPVLAAARQSRVLPRLQRFGMSEARNTSSKEELVTQATSKMLVEEVEVKALSKTVADMEKAVEKERQRRLLLEKQVLQRRKKKEAQQMLAHEAITVARDASAALKDINRELDEGEKRLEKVNKEYEYICKLKFEIEAQKEELQDLKKQLDTCLKNIAHMETQIAIKTEEYQASKEKENEAYYSLKSAEETYKKKRQTELDQLTAAFSTLWQTIDESCIHYSHLLELTKPETQPHSTKAQPVLNAELPHQSIDGHASTLSIDISEFTAPQVFDGHIALLTAGEQTSPQSPACKSSQSTDSPVSPQFKLALSPSPAQSHTHIQVHTEDTEVITLDQAHTQTTEVTSLGEVHTKDTEVITVDQVLTKDTEVTTIDQVLTKDTEVITLGQVHTKDTEVIALDQSSNRKPQNTHIHVVGALRHSDEFTSTVFLNHKSSQLIL